MFGDKGQGGKSSREGTRRVSGGRSVEVERLPHRGAEAWRVKEQALALSG